jgi:hypothetical protein
MQPYRAFQPFEESLDVASRPYEHRPGPRAVRHGSPTRGVHQSDFLRDGGGGTRKAGGVES